MSHNERLKALTSELDQLRSVLREAMTQSGEHQGETLALVKVCRGVSLGAWMEIAEQNGMTEFLPLPLKSELQPHTVRFMDILESYARKLQVDPATGLADKTAFDALLDMEIERSLRNRHTLSMALLRVGTPGNDARTQELMVVAVAELLSRRIRRYDIAARIKGNRFALIFPGSGMHRMQLLMARLLGEIDKIAEDHGLPEGLARSGLASIKGRRRITPEDFLKLAEEALEHTLQKGAGPIKAAAIPDISVTPAGSLVQSYEKLFLFTGQ